MTTIVWFRQDLRLSDNPALSWAAERGEVIPVYILDETGNAPYGRMGGASRWWLHHSLKALSAALGGLHILKGDPEALLKDLADKSKADAISWNRCYEPHAIARDRKIKKTFQDLGLEAKSFNGNLLHEPWDFQTKAGGPYKVFTPFWRALRPAGMNMPLPRPKARIVTPRSGETLKGLALLPEKPDWAAGWDDIWTPGEKGARDRLDAFLENGLAGYGDGRNRPDLEKVSRLSPHLHFGEISPRQIVTATRLACERISSLAREGEKFLSEIGWREFSYHLLCHFPDLPEKNLRSDFDAYPWRESADDLKAWQRGMTGYPLVDAGMRQLWQTGWMHNRVRMVTASFLIKHLRIDWRQGEAWFWDTLVDADLANNSASWQWVAGSGADAAPYFRIFNPVSQGRKFDPAGVYVRRWCPELSKLPDKYLHAPFEAPVNVMEEAGITLGTDYPLPIVDHAEARKAALAGYERVRKTG